MSLINHPKIISEYLPPMTKPSRDSKQINSEIGKQKYNSVATSTSITEIKPDIFLWHRHHGRIFGDIMISCCSITNPNRWLTILPMGPWCEFIQNQYILRQYSTNFGISQTIESFFINEWIICNVNSSVTILVCYIFKFFDSLQTVILYLNFIYN